MIKTNDGEYMYEIVSVPLKNISPHHQYDYFRELLATTNYMLPSNDILTGRALALNLLMHPIVVIRFKRSQDRYLCIGGIRSLLLAKSSMDLDKTLPVSIVNKLSYREKKLMVNADMLLSPLLMSIRNPSTIGAVYQLMKKEEIDALLEPDMHNKSMLAEHMEYAKNTVFSPKSSMGDGSGAAS